MGQTLLGQAEIVVKLFFWFHLVCFGWWCTDKRFFWLHFACFVLLSALGDGVRKHYQPLYGMTLSLSNFCLLVVFCTEPHGSLPAASATVLYICSEPHGPCLQPMRRCFRSALRRFLPAALFGEDPSIWSCLFCFDTGLGVLPIGSEDPSIPKDPSLQRLDPSICKDPSLQPWDPSMCKDPSPTFWIRVYAKTALQPLDDTAIG